MLQIRLSVQIAPGVDLIVDLKQPRRKVIWKIVRRLSNDRRKHMDWEIRRLKCLEVAPRSDLVIDLEEPRGEIVRKGARYCKPSGQEQDSPHR